MNFLLLSCWVLPLFEAATRIVDLIQAESQDSHNTQRARPWLARPYKGTGKLGNNESNHALNSMNLGVLTY